MTDPRSPCTIVVGPQKEDGYRHIALRHCGRPFFTVSHRHVQSALLASFESRRKASDPLGGASVVKNRGNDTISGAPVSNAQLREYLCVFHGEELKDQHGRYYIGNPITHLTAYAVHDGTETTFALQNIAASSFTAGRHGIYVHGERYSSRLGAGVPYYIDVDGMTYTAATDVYWLASPLVMKPLYVSERVGFALNASGRARAGDGGVSLLASRWGWEGSDASSRSRSPIPSSSFPYHKSPPPAGGPHGLPSQYSHRSTAPRSFGAQVLFEFSPSSSCGDTSAGSVAVVRTAPDELALGITKMVPAHDAMTFCWCPHHVRVPGLSASTASLSFIVSEHATFADAQVMYMFDAPQRTLHIIRITGLLSETVGDCSTQAEDSRSPGMEVICTLRDRGCPVLLPCVRVSSPQPVLLLDYPSTGEVSLVSTQQLLSFQRTGDACRLQDYIIASATIREFAVDTSPAKRRRSDVLDVDSRSRQMCQGSDACSLSNAITAVELQDECTVTFCSSMTSGNNYSAAPYNEAQKVEIKRDGDAKCHTIDFPSIRSHGGTLLRLLLEAMEAVIGPHHTYAFEYALLSRCWAEHQSGSTCSKRSAGDHERVCMELLSEIVHEACQPSPCMEKDCGTRPGMSERDSGDVCLISAFLDSHSVTARSIEDIAIVTNPIEGASGGLHGKSGNSHLPLWTTETCALAMVAAHLLCESCKLQEHLWPYVDRLAKLLLTMSTILGLEKYIQYYKGVVDSRTQVMRDQDLQRMPVSESLLTYLPRGKLNDVFVFPFHSHDDPKSSSGEGDNSTTMDRDAAFLKNTAKLRLGLQPMVPPSADEQPLLHCRLALGYPLDLVDTLHQLLHGGGDHANICCGDVQEDLCWPTVRSPLPRDHPITQASSIVSVYYQSFNGKCDIGRQGWWIPIYEALASSSLDRAFLTERLNPAVGQPLLRALAEGSRAIGEVCDDEQLSLLGRSDRIRDPAVLSAVLDPGMLVLHQAEERATARPRQAALADEDDGVMVGLDFPQVWRDSRLDSAQVYFNTSQPIVIRAQGNQPAALLKELAVRVCAMPVGRGMMTLGTHSFTARDSLPVPKLNLDGRTGEGVFISNTVQEMQPGVLLWPTVHNGCAAGLRFLPLPKATAEADDIATGTTVQAETSVTRHWIVYQTKHAHDPAARAGFLLAAGMLGHLKVLQLTDIYSLLVSPRVHYHGRETITIAVMLGLSCSFRGTSNDLVFRCLTMHAQSLTPSEEEIDVSLDVQTCALVSVGLLCQRTPSSFLVDVFLTEMSRLPTDEHCVNREGYALGAGYGLGLMLLGIGDAHRMPGVETKLFAFLEGAQRDHFDERLDAATEAFFERRNEGGDQFLTRARLARAAPSTTNYGCSRVCEGKYYNTSISGPPSVMALCLMYLKTGNHSIAARLMPPARLFALQAVSPTMCLLRTFSALLVQWSTIQPTHGFVHKNCVPEVLQSLTPDQAPSLQLAQQQVHYLMINHGHCIAGAAYAIGFRFAGTFNHAARDLIIRELKGFVKGYLGATGIAVPTLQRSTGAYELCISACCVAVALVMAGSGDVETFSLFQRLHSRSTSSFGMHMALSISSGLLFLGGGRLTLSTSTDALAALLLALFPVWPTNAEDNVHHLQALRHLYTLAVVPRVMETFDVRTNQPISVPVRIVLKKGETWQTQVSPCITVDRSGSGGDGVRSLQGGETGGEVASQQQGTSRTHDSSETAGIVTDEKEQQEVHLETPCLYPPPEVIDRIEIHSTRHYSRVLYADEDEVGESGLVVRLLSTQTDQQSLMETRATRWIRRLFGGRRCPLAESVVLIDTAKLLLASQKRTAQLLFGRSAITPPQGTAKPDEGTVLPPCTVQAGPEICDAHDAARAMERSLERRYRSLFVCGAGRSRDGQPLYRAVIEGAAWGEISRAIAQNPAGTQGYPVDFSVVCSEDRGDGGAAAVERWLTEAVHFYCGPVGTFTRLSHCIRDRATQLQSRGSRTSSVLKISRDCKMSFGVVQRIVDCCFGAPSQ